MSTTRLLQIFIAVLLTTSICTHIHAHPDIDEQVIETTKEIALDPTRPILYFKRGKLHLQHEEYDNAMADLELALQLDPSLYRIHIARARTFYQAEWFNSAKAVLDTFLRDEPEDSAALLLRAQTLAALKQYIASAKDYEHAIERLNNPVPDYYIELAEAYKKAGIAFYEDALHSIDAGITRHGPLVTLQLIGIELEQKLHRTDQAIDRLHSIAKQSQRKEHYLIWEGAIYEAAHRYEEAHVAYQAGLVAIEKLPERFQTLKATINLKRKATEGLDRLTNLSEPTSETVDENNPLLP